MTLAAVALGCRSALETFPAEQFFSALGARVKDPMREPKYDSARVKIVRAALIPSRVFDDTSAWTSMTASRRTLAIGGRFAGVRYRLEATRAAAPPHAAAESRHTINLTELAPDQYAWDTDVAYGLGDVSARDFGAFMAALLASAEGRVEPQLRGDIHATIPRATEVFGMMFRLDSVRTTSPGDKSTVALFSATITPEGLDARYPNFAQYVRKYLQTMRYRLTLTDHAGAAYLESSLQDGVLLLRVRTLHGGMIPLSGPAQSLPDSLRLNGELTMRVKHFTVGFRDYHADFILARSERERSVSIVTRTEPDWDLPLITERLLRTPLRRPFQGSGTLFRIGVRAPDSTGAPAVLHRRLHLEVQESTILRFIGRLGAVAVSDFTGKAEREQFAWLNELFTALIADIRAFSL